MKTAEEYFKERFSAVYYEYKHERKTQRFDYYDMTDFAAQYASEAIREKDKEIEQLRAPMRDLLNCPKCGYTKEDQEIHGDHHLCSGEIPEPSGKTEQLTGPVVGIEDDTPFNNAR